MLITSAAPSRPRRDWSMTTHVLEGIDGVPRPSRRPKLAPMVFAAWGADVVQIQPVRLGIDLDVASVLARSGNHPIHVDLMRLARTDQPNGGMAKNANVANFHPGAALGGAFGRRARLVAGLASNSALRHGRWPRISRLVSY